MSIFEPSPSPWTSRMLSVLRIVTGAILITNGTAKLFGFPGDTAPGQTVSLASQMGIGSILEIIGGLAIVLGLFTRPIAFVLAGEMAVAYFQFHTPKAFFPSVNNGSAAVLNCFIFLYLVFAGAGSWSLDAMIARSKAGQH